MGFKEKVIAFVKKIPKGKVVSYGQVAAALGKPRAARQVGGILRGLGIIGNLPWWRVLNNKGVISIKGNWTADKKQQAEFLRKEGVKVMSNLTLDINKYRWKN